MPSPQFPFTPETDGIDHVNVYSRARTPEGQLLSNFAPTPFVLYGQRFASVEGFYQGMRFADDARRKEVAATTGPTAKGWGNHADARHADGDPIRAWDGRTVGFHGPDFLDEARAAVRAKVEQNPAVHLALVATERLPLTHYYVLGASALPPHGDSGWLQDCLSTLRREFRDEATVRAVLGPFAGAAVSELVAAVRGSDENAACGAARALAFQDGLPEAAVVALGSALNHPNPNVRQRALRTLVQLDIPPERAGTIFLAALDGEDDTLRRVAERRLAALTSPGA